MATKVDDFSVSRFAMLGTIMVVLLFVVMGCATSVPTSTPVAPAQPAQPIAPTAAPELATASIAATPTPRGLLPTPTKVIPTATAKADIDKPQYGGVLRYPGNSRSFDNMDPAFSIQTGFREPMYAIFSNLVQLDSDGTAKPDLAKSWDVSGDGKTITFHLQEGVKFHDGTTLDAQAIKWNFDRFLDPKVGSSRKPEMVPLLKSVEVVDNQTVRIQLSSPSRSFMAMLTDKNGEVASPTAVEKLNSYANRNGDFGRKPVGSGPFMFDEWVPDSFVAVKRFPDYWEKGKPYLNAVQFPIVPDTSVQFAMLRTGEIDIMKEMVADDAIASMSNPRLKVVKQDGARTIYFFFRYTKKPWDNKALRQAFAYAMNRQAFSDVLYKGTAMPAYTSIGPVYGQFYDDTIKTYAYDPKMAQAKLTEAGYPNGFSYTFLCQSDAFSISWCETIQSMQAQVGIKANIQMYQKTIYWADFVAHKIDGPINSGMSARSEIDLDLRMRYYSGNNYGMDYGNPQVDSLLDQGVAIYDVAEAKKVYNKILTILADEAPVITLVYEPTFYGSASAVRGFEPFMDKQVRAKYLWFSK